MGQRGRPRSPGLLTPREQEVFDLIRAGRSNAEIGEALGISVETVKQHVSQVLAKLGVTTREDAAAWPPEESRAWWAALPRWALIAGAGAVLVALAVLAILAVVIGESSDETSTEVRAPSASPGFTVSPQLTLVGGQTPEPQTTTPTEAPIRTPVKLPVESNSVHIISADGTGDRFLAAGYNPVWSPQGDQIAFVGYSTGPNLGGTDWVDVIPVGGGSMEEIGSYEWGDVGSACNATVLGRWSPDGSQFLAWPANAGPGFLADVSSGTNRPLSECNGGWLPDGRRYFEGRCDQPASPECIRVTDDQTDEQLAVGNNVTPSPDGKILAYYRDNHLFTFDVAMSTETEEVVPSASGFGPPAWSPGSDAIAYMDASSVGQISVVNLGSGEIHTIADGALPRWSPAGGLIAYYYQSNSSLCSGIKVVSAADGTEVFSIPRASYTFDWSPDGSHLAYTLEERAPTPVAEC